VNVLGLDTATSATAVALARDDGWLREARDEVAPGDRPQHAQRLLALAGGLLAEAGIGWPALGMIAVGIGPGGYTGLRIGLASARGLALAYGARLVGVGTLRALAEPAGARSVAAVVDARRGEVFVAVYRDGVELLAPRVSRPAELARLALAGGPDTLAVGDGALRFRELIEGGGVAVAPSDSRLHTVSAGAICRLAVDGHATTAAPDYQRLPDAELALGGRTP
jgi:tRNA threonylcarbamoyladenosine biosynthesis protein TsaB